MGKGRAKERMMIGIKDHERKAQEGNRREMKVKEGCQKLLRQREHQMQAAIPGADFNNK